MSQYRYDPLGRRIWSKVEGSTAATDEARYVYDGWRVIEQRAANNSLKASFVYDSYIDDVVAMYKPSTGYYFYHHDDQFSVTAVTDAQGNVLERVRYDDWGRPTFINPSTGAESDRSQIGNPLAFTGREWDAATGYYYHRHRYYDPKLGRFINRDPIGIWGDLLNLGNGQTYTFNNPYSTLDPYGLSVFEFIGDAADSISDVAGGVACKGNRVADSVLGTAGDVATAVGYSALDLTWGLPQTAIGMAYAGTELTLGNAYVFLKPNDSDYVGVDFRGYINGDGIEVYSPRIVPMLEGSAITLGPFVTYYNQDTPDEFIFQGYGGAGNREILTRLHENQHVRQSRTFGPLYPLFGASSVLHNVTSYRDNNTFIEVDANNRARRAKPTTNIPCP